MLYVYMLYLKFHQNYHNMLYMFLVPILQNLLLYNQNLNIHHGLIHQKQDLLLHLQMRLVILQLNLHQHILQKLLYNLNLHLNTNEHNKFLHLQKNSSHFHYLKPLTKWMN